MLIFFLFELFLQIVSQTWKRNKEKDSRNKIKGKKKQLNES